MNFITTTCHRYIAKNVKLCTVDDTDSFICLINDVYEIIKCDISKFDTSNYAIDNAHGIPLADKKSTGFDERS